MRVAQAIVDLHFCRCYTIGFHFYFVLPGSEVYIIHVLVDLRLIAGQSLWEKAVLVYNIYTWFVGSKHSHWLMVVRTILLWQITECSLVGRWSFSVMISELWRFA